MEINFYNRTFKELKENRVLGFKDPYHIMSSLGPKMREAMLHNPSGYSDDEVCQILAVDGDVVVGCTNSFSNRLLINGEVVPCQSGSYLFSHEDYRKDNVGGEIFYRQTNQHPTKNCCFAGISQMAIGLYHALRYTVFEFPRVIYLRKSQSVIHSLLKTESALVNPLVWFADTCLWVHRGIIKLRNTIINGGCQVEEVKECPLEIEKIFLQDKHPFKELHDKAWFDWHLHYTFSNDKRTKIRLYVVKRNEITEAFILTKQEFFEQASSRGFKNVYLGSVMEWGIAAGSKLEEKDIVLLSLFTFDKDVDGVQYASTDMKTIKQLKKWLFAGVGVANMGVRLRTVKDVTTKEIENWRIRLAASDTAIN